MSERAGDVDVLVIQFWIEAVDPIAAAFQNIGITPRIKRVDIEPALNAALGRLAWHLVIYDPKTPGIGLKALQAAMRTYRCNAPLVIVDDSSALEDRIVEALRERSC